MNEIGLEDISIKWWQSHKSFYLTTFKGNGINKYVENDLQLKEYIRNDRIKQFKTIKEAYDCGKKYFPGHKIIPLIK